eukprot:TRINITY_DN3420_c0_g1_i1.p1 TRINITY_DN3420_c0_g1~~TRINITY_DN3420_c0_g1_i1.p1  ORF type:complete len:672 (+),score=107.56 TRINITY_DN3420_c0_g1_i1:355-2370(+)
MSAGRQASPNNRCERIVDHGIEASGEAVSSWVYEISRLCNNVVNGAAVFWLRFLQAPGFDSSDALNERRQRIHFISNSNLSDHPGLSKPTLFGGITPDQSDSDEVDDDYPNHDAPHLNNSGPHLATVQPSISRPNLHRTVRGAAKSASNTRHQGLLEDLKSWLVLKILYLCVWLRALVHGLFKVFSRVTGNLLSFLVTLLMPWKWFTAVPEAIHNFRSDVKSRRYRLLNASALKSPSFERYGPGCTASGFTDDDDDDSDSAPSSSERNYDIPPSLPCVDESSAKTWERNREAVLKAHGCPYESYEVITSDGYIISLDRIPRRDTTEAVFFQHGIFDTSFAWLASDPPSSLAIRAYEDGCDVWLGNFRGSPMRHVNPDITSSEYWSFTMNEHGNQDITAMIEKIREVKQGELEAIGREDPQPRITAVAHSMGAACILMYLVFCLHYGRPHHLCRAVLLSPAGYHITGPQLLGMELPDLLGPIVDIFLRLTGPLGFHSFNMVHERIRYFILKLVLDLQHNPGTRALMSYWIGRLLGGDPTSSDHTFHAVHDITWHILHGTGVGIFWHFWYNWRAKKFQAFDYGRDRNLKEYGQAKPLDFHTRFHLIDVPVHFVFGLEDSLIGPANVMRHFEALQRYRPDLAHLRAVPKAGHLDFTIGGSDQIISYVLKVLHDS